MRDQSFISSVSRKTEDIGRELVGDKLIPQGKTLAPSRLDERNDKEDKLVKEARKHQVDLVLLPRGMSKRTRNNSRWNPKTKSLEWTTEIVLQPPPGTNATSETFLTGPHSSTATLFSMLLATFNSRDKKGKGKPLSEAETSLRNAQWRWLETFKPEKPGQADDAETDNQSNTSLSDEQEAEPAFLLLLSLYTPPPRASRPDQDAEDDTQQVQVSELPIKPRPRKYSVATPSSSLQSMISGATILEFPTFELWTREGFLRAKLKGEIEVVERLASLPERPQRSNDGWDRGRGRGRGRGGGFGSRGRGSHQGCSTWNSRGEDGQGDHAHGRTQDSGWQKRSATVALGEEAELTGTETPKHARTEQLAEASSAPVAALSTGLVAYDSD
ncbi:hypothetical protein ACM66B_003848 [Microbotryomycetes sp. NB124-2]